MRRKDTFTILLLLILVLIFFKKLLNPHKVFLGGDLTIFYPVREFLISNIKKGILPLWNPYAFCGSPSASNTTIFGMFYPLNIIFLFLPLDFAFNIALIMHIFLAGIFMYILVRSFGLDEISSLVSSVTFIFGGAFITSIPAGAIDLITSVAWMPLIFFLFNKALKDNKTGYIYSVLAGVAIGLQGLGGLPQISLMTIYLLFSYLIYVVIGYMLKKEINLENINRTVFVFGIALLVGIGIYAVQIFPSLEIFLKHSTRSFNMDYQSVSYCSLPLKQLLTFFMPNLFNNPITGSYLDDGHPFEEICKYVGLFPLILALIAIALLRNKYVKFCSLFLFVSILIALGNHSPVYRLCYHLLPGFKAFRWPVRWLCLSTFFISLLAGFGLFFLTSQMNHKQNLRFLIKGLLSFNILIIGILCLDYLMKIDIAHPLTKWVTIPFFDKETDLQYRYSIIKESLFNFTLLLTAITLCLFAFYKNKIRPSLFKILILAITIFDLWVFGQKFIIPIDKKLYLKSRQWEFFKDDKDLYRIFVEPPIDDYSAPANGYFVFTGEIEDYKLRDYNRFKYEIKRFPQILNAKYLLTTRFIDTPDVEFIKTIEITISDLFLFNSKKYRIYESPANIYQYKDFLPRAFIVHKIIIAKDEDEIFERLNDLSINDLREVAILEGGGFFLKTPSEFKSLGKDYVEIVRYSHNHIKLKAHLKKTGLLVLNEIFFPGWQAYVDGKREHIFKANNMMRSVYLKEGNHTIEFVYSPSSFKIGAGITILTILILSSLGIKQGYITLKRKSLPI